MDSGYSPVGLVRNLTYSFPIGGVIRTGTTVERAKQGRTLTLPSKLDEFILTDKIRDDAGQWVRHELDAKLREQYGTVCEDGTKRLRRLPVTLAFDRPELSISEQYAAFSQEGRPICVGNGEKARRRTMTEDGPLVEDYDCPGSDDCEFGKKARCGLFLRLLVRIEGQSELDGLFILRTGSVNCVTDTRTFVEHLRALFGGRVAGVPLWLVLEPKQTVMSRQSVFWHASFRPRFATLLQAAGQLNATRQEELAAGIDRAAGESMLTTLRGNGVLAEDGADDGAMFDDLLAARFMDPETEHRVEVKGRRPAMAPSAAASLAVAELQGLLEGRPVAANSPESPVVASQG